MLEEGKGECCDYFEWHKPKFSVRENVVIKELLDDIDKLCEEKNRGNGTNFRIGGEMTLEGLMKS